MARNLSDIIRQNLQAGQKAKATDETAAATRLLGARTGKATGVEAPSGPRRSAMAEAGARMETQSKLDELRERGTVRAEQLRGTELEMAQKEAQDLRRVDAERERMREAAKREEGRILQDLELGKMDLDSAEGRAKLEQLGFLLNLQDQKYVYNLQLEGRKSRLVDEMGFREALQMAAYKDMQRLMEEDIAFKEMMDADDREFQEKLGQINIDYAMQIAANEATAANKQAIYGGVGEAVSGTVGELAKREAAEPDPEPNPDAGKGKGKK